MHLALDSDPRIAVAASDSHAGAGAGAFLDSFDAFVARFRARPALRIRAEDGSWRELTYGAMRAEWRRVGSWLIERGIVRGTRVALLGESCPEWTIALLASMSSGAATVPLDAKLTVDEVAVLLQHASPRVVFASRSQLAKARAAAREVPSIEDIIVLDGEMADSQSLPSLRPRRIRAARHRAEGETALIVYTSGTTGNPKGVETTFGNLLFEARAMDRVIGPLGDERFLSVLPLNHLYELICGLFTPLHRGAQITYTDSLLPDDVTRLLREERITSLVGVPLLFRALKRGIEQAIRAKGPEAERRFARAVTLSRFVPGNAARRALFAPVLSAFAPSLRACYSGGAALGEDVSRFFATMGIPIYQGYGLTETSPVIATCSPRANRIGSVGKPLSGVEVRIVRKNPDDLAGEIQTRGPHTMSGYYGAPEPTREILLEDGWLATGDLGHVDEDGFLFVTGRSKDFIVLGGGKKVHPDEVEEALGRSTELQEVCVVGAPGRTNASRGFDEVCAVVVPSIDMRVRFAGDLAALHAATEEEIARTTECLASFKRPTRVELRFAPLPRTATRKLRRPQVAQLLEAGALVNDVFVDHFAFALGEDAQDVERAAELGLTLTTAKSFRDAGFGRHHVCRPATTAYDLARRAVEAIAPALGDVGAIIYSTCLPLNGNLGDDARFRETRDVKHVMDFPVSHLQADFDLPRAAAIGLNQQACTSMIGALRIAKALLRDDASLGRILCVTADRFPAGAIYEQAYNLISDGASACIASFAPAGYRVVSSHHITNGALARASDDETVGGYFNYTHRLLTEQLAKAGLKVGAIDWVVPQNTNVKAWKILSRVLGVDPERVFHESIGDVGHIISSDNVVNLLRLEKTGRVKPGDKLLLFMAGFGLNWQSVILEKA